MELAAISIACLSFIVAALALGWQVAAWLLDGPRVRAVLQHGVVGRGGVVVTTVNKDARLSDMSLMREQGWRGPDVIGVAVSNLGRAKVKVTGFGVVLKRGGLSANYPLSNEWSPPLPHWLEPGESATWYAPLQDAHALVDTTRRTVNPRAGGAQMKIQLGSGREVTTARHLEL